MRIVATSERSGASAGTPEAYIESLPERRRSQVRELHELIRQSAPDLDPPSIRDARVRDQPISLGLGTRGRMVSCRARQQRGHDLSLHVLIADESGRLEAYEDRLPKADVGRSCVRFKQLDDVDIGVLDELIRKSAETLPPGAIEG